MAHHTHRWVVRGIAVMIALDLALCWKHIAPSATSLVAHITLRPDTTGIDWPLAALGFVALALAGVVSVIGLAAYRRFGLWASWAFLLVATLFGLGGVPYLLRPLAPLGGIRAVCLLVMNLLLAAVLWWAMASTRVSERGAR